MAENSANGISIRNLYKVFGPSPSRFIEAVRGGMSKQELNESIAACR